MMGRVQLHPARSIHAKRTSAFLGGANRLVGSHSGVSLRAGAVLLVAWFSRALFSPGPAPHGQFVLCKIFPNQMAGGAATSSTSFPKSCAECSGARAAHSRCEAGFAGKSF